MFTILFLVIVASAGGVPNPLGPLIKGGQCPPVDSSVDCSLEEQLMSECRFDGQCDGEEKCCQTDCAMMCTEPVDCPPLPCPYMQCESGYEVDENGCETCDCIDEIAERGYDALPDRCPKLKCSEKCEYGVYEFYGCKTCLCKPNPCDFHPCDRDEVCKLKKVFCIRGPCPPQPVCVRKPRKLCGPLCKKYCRFGFAYVNGCPVCKCLPNPCQAVKCGFGQKCELLKVPNCYGPKCRLVASCTDKLVCPRPSVGELGICINKCVEDDDCEGDQLCCLSNGCGGSVCTDGVPIKKNFLMLKSEEESSSGN